MDIEVLARFAERVKPLPWRMFTAVVVVSFLLASAISVIFGWFLMGQIKIESRPSEFASGEFTGYIGSGLSKSIVDKILERNLFNSEGLIGEEGKGDGEKISKTQLPLKVLGIIYGGNPFNGIAMVENTQMRNVNSFMVGDMLSPDAKVVEIQMDQIIIDNQGRKEFAPLEDVELRRSTRKGGSPKKANAPESLAGNGYATDAPPENYKEDGFERKGTNIELSSEYKNRLLGADFASVLQDAKASPNIVDGVLKGWRMDRIRQGSFYEKSGIQNGDIVEEINGVVLSDAGQSIKVLQNARNESEIDIKLIRNGQKMNFSLKVK
jgi:type II secretion system protein C